MSSLAVWRFAEQPTKAIKAMMGMNLNAFIVLNVFVCFPIGIVIRQKLYKFHTKIHFSHDYFLVL